MDVHPAKFGDFDTRLGKCKDMACSLKSNKSGLSLLSFKYMTSFVVRGDVVSSAAMLIMVIFTETHITGPF